MNRYSELRERQQKEFNALPIRAAFNIKRFEEVMRNWGLDPEKDIDKIYSIDYGCFIRKKDAPLLHETRKRHDTEMAEAIAGDKTGDGFIYEMFLYELRNHEYGYTGDPTDTLDALGYSYKDLEKDVRLTRGFEMAKTQIMREEECM